MPASTVGTAQLVQHPAGHDGELRAVVEDLGRGGWFSTRALLHRTWGDPGLWAARTQVIGVAAGHNNVLHLWEREEPGAFGLISLGTRVMVDRAVLAGQQQPGSPEAAELAETARQWCWQAASVLDGDPVPWLGLLTLASLDPKQFRSEHRVPAPDQMLPPGPWALFGQARRIDPWGREVFHRMLRVWAARGEGGTGAEFLAAYLPGAPEGSALHALPLYLHVDRYRRAKSKSAALLQWTNDESVRSAVMAAFSHWRLAFERGARWPVADESHLAHALWASRRPREAAQVFTAMHPFIAPEPWVTMSPPDRAGELLRQAQAQSYAATG
ncbi:hypothetical protein [Kitasatospora phosalacinea]|uniref:Uncharacterized protein n=1 Tax=Kitasatospora phosalacinea TaxID=2065 RepID=A0A9W6PPE7_9ACTN|nr:hypothetical protein [Kitasatospora phosalacinea]GLW58746.1 hypothetical protein Kpho01_67570 [Kitasatospora phosalacinea]